MLPAYGIVIVLFLGRHVLMRETYTDHFYTFYVLLVLILSMTENLGYRYDVMLFHLD